MNQHFLTAMLLASCLLNALGQTAGPVVQWQGAFGGTNQDQVFGVEQTPDGGILLAGTSRSGVSGNKSAGQFGGGDFWLVRLDATGRKLWDKSYGGSGDEGLYGLVVIPDGGCVLGGYSTSGVGGTKTSPAYGLRDFWLVRVDAQGNQLWDKSFGGTDDDAVLALQRASDGGWIAGGYSYSAPGGNKTAASLGGGDFWVVRLDAEGNKLWDRSFGGTGGDFCYSLRETTNGGFVLAGISDSPRSESKTAFSYGGSDFWVVRLNASGNKLWDKSFGGSGEDGYLNVVVALTQDGGFLVGGDSSSGVDGNKAATGYGLEDFWVVCLDANGSKLWERSYGGNGSDYLTSLVPMPDGGFVLGGGSSSGRSGNKTSQNFGSSDYWVIRVDRSGAVLWEQAYGGVNADAFANLSMCRMADSSLLLGGDSQSGVSGNKSVPGFGAEDFWALKLSVPVSAPRLWAVWPQNPGVFSFRLQGESGRTYMTEFSTNFLAWKPLSTNQLSGPEAVILDAGATNDQRRFYRAWHLP